MISQIHKLGNLLIRVIIDREVSLDPVYKSLMNLQKNSPLWNEFPKNNFVSFMKIFDFLVH